ncbi:MAG: hypothetical protein JNN07_28995 [Verrucomicrobiales bacterium]|nr:hypothetical protein [Verrucomicrobiales bacterium]
MTSSILLSVTLVLAVTVANIATAKDTFAVFKSQDQGQTWRRSDAGMPAQSRINAFGSANGTLFAGTDSGIFASKDEALSWKPAEGAAISSGRVISLATLGRSVFGGADGKGLLESSDGGASWALARSFPSPKVRCLLVHGGKIFAGTDDNGVFASEGGGQAWTHLSAGLPPHAQIFALSAARGRLFAGLYSQGLYAWDEPKQSWERIGPVKPLALTTVQDTLIAGHNPGGIYWSGDLGATWSKGRADSPAAALLEFLHPGDSEELTAEAPVWELGSYDSLVFVGASAGIYSSENQGRTWKRARAGLPARSPGIAFLLKGEFVLAGIHIRGSDAQPSTAVPGR